MHVHTYTYIPPTTTPHPLPNFPLVFTINHKTHFHITNKLWSHAESRRHYPRHTCAITAIGWEHKACVTFTPEAALGVDTATIATGSSLPALVNVCNRYTPNRSEGDDEHTAIHWLCVHHALVRADIKAVTQKLQNTATKSTKREKQPTTTKSNPPKKKHNLALKIKVWSWRLWHQHSPMQLPAESFL